MRKQGNPRNRSLESLIVFDYYIDDNSCSRPEPKAKTPHEEGWQLFIALCSGCLFLPALIF